MAPSFEEVAGVVLRRSKREARPRSAMVSCSRVLELCQQNALTPAAQLIVFLSWFSRPSIDPMSETPPEVDS
jgi:hypothetical protein